MRARAGADYRGVCVYFLGDSIIKAPRTGITFIRATILTDDQPASEHYRAMVAEIHDLAARAASLDIRAELLLLAERFARLPPTPMPPKTGADFFVRRSLPPLALRGTPLRWLRRLPEGFETRYSATNPPQPSVSLDVVSAGSNREHGGRRICQD